MSTNLKSLYIGVRGRGVVIGGIPGSIPRTITPRKARVYARQLIAAALEAERREREVTEDLSAALDLDLGLVSKGG